MNNKLKDQTADLSYRREDELDLLIRARDRLVELAEESETDNPTPWWVREHEELLDGAGYNIALTSHDPVWIDPGTAELIVALRGCAPYLIDRLEWAIDLRRKVAPTDLPEYQLARVILGETEGQNNK